MTTATPEPQLRTFADAENVLASRLPGYTARPAQQKLAAAIEAVITACETDPAPQHLLAEAGTGTGKSLGALIPAILGVSRNGRIAGGRVVIATSTLALMTQYLEKDLPFLKEHLPVDFTYAPLKGLGQYVCKDKLQEATSEQVANLADLIEETMADGSTSTGDRDTLTTPVAPEEWRHVAVGANECPGRSGCAFGQTCFGYKAKDEAAEANIVVTNHKMAMLDVKVKMSIAESNENGIGESVILGDRDLMIFDEGHELPETAQSTLGFEVKEGGILAWADQALNFVTLQSATDDENAERDLEAIRDTEKLVETIQAKLVEIREIVVKLMEIEGATLDVDFVEEHYPVFEALTQAITRAWHKIKAAKITKGEKGAQGTKQKRLLTLGESYLTNIARVLEAPEIDMVAWPETYTARSKKTGEQVTRWALTACPIEVGPILREELWNETSAVILSATLSTGNSGFSYAAKTLGLEKATTLDVGTPFDYERQMLMYVPGAKTEAGEPMPIPSAKDKDARAAWQTWAIETIAMLVRDAARGGAMLLFTSKTDMIAAYNLLAERIGAAGFPVYMQGKDHTNKEIAQKFKEQKDSVLFGMKSFFVGVDFPGDTNRLVVMMKLPFAVPSDPVIAARSKKIKERGGNDFAELALPLMMLTLGQGFGRLLRTVTDYGIVAILDPRLSTTHWGKNIVRGLPPAPVTTSLDDVKTYYAAWREALGAAS
ncbi:ATP-dependent DNA helicase [Kitasatospora viridis]|uniref:ATP-dependent DNA helicase DinG n=1 Tax=Kitasatospora viridis TaxID=281105 RepID=A0A561SAA1_9ACTN|nr:ATP-dependent DNA helicase [Kitasatospora viridis]TWF71802.1 ATP-dependent DNA helicase DinG [Kitasatospora viridis]